MQLNEEFWMLGLVSYSRQLSRGLKPMQMFLLYMLWSTDSMKSLDTQFLHWILPFWRLSKSSSLQLRVLSMGKQ